MIGNTGIQYCEGHGTGKAPANRRSMNLATALRSSVLEGYFMSLPDGQPEPRPEPGPEPGPEPMPEPGPGPEPVPSVRAKPTSVLAPETLKLPLFRNHRSQQTQVTSISAPPF